MTGSFLQMKFKPVLWEMLMRA